MKKYNIQNYLRYKADVKTSIANLEGKFWDEYTADELIIKFLQREIHCSPQKYQHQKILLL